MNEREREEEYDNGIKSNKLTHIYVITTESHRVIMYYINKNIVFQHSFGLTNN